MSLENPERDLMDMYYGQKREPIHLYKLEIEQLDPNSIRPHSDERVKSEHSIDQELYS